VQASWPAVEAAALTKEEALSSKPAIVLVHGFWEGRSIWSGSIAIGHRLSSITKDS
jgi:hypothetical protein